MGRHNALGKPTTTLAAHFSISARHWEGEASRHDAMHAHRAQSSNSLDTYGRHGPRPIAVQVHARPEKASPPGVSLSHHPAIQRSSYEPLRPPPSVRPVNICCPSQYGPRARTGTSAPDQRRRHLAFAHGHLRRAACGHSVRAGPASQKGKGIRGPRAHGTRSRLDTARRAVKGSSRRRLRRS
ncbi:hypothetical protein C8Q80DRAFT_342030 [Daedaleopsis nitida]|nr:hypothetical protein C8Q80DRAFT_342030 [Daedaleopsis nitida]